MVELTGSLSSASHAETQNGVSLEGCWLIENLHYYDERGNFRKILPTMHSETSLDFVVRQVNLSTNPQAGTLRGLHYQSEPFLESKLISCIVGSVFDVLLDMRPDSPTYGKHSCFILTPNSGSLLVPPLVAHGYQTLEINTSLLYLHSNDYSVKNSRGINPTDPELGIVWRLPIAKLSESDRKLPYFSEVNV